MSRHYLRIGDDCRNCGTVLTGEYCHVCGQSAKEPRRAVIGLVQDVFVDTLAIDGKLFRTIWLLVTRPGRLAKRYLDGKRVRYSPPFRLYLFTSVFFFFLVFWLANLDDVSFTDDTSSASVGLYPEEGVFDEILAALDEAGLEPETLPRPRRNINVSLELDGNSAPDRQSSQADDDVDDQSILDKETTWEDIDYNGPAFAEPFLSKVFEGAQRAREDPRLFFAQVRENLPRAMLIAPVLYALILLLLYFYRRKYLIYDHLIVSLYMHGALYAHLLIFLLLGQVLDVWPIATLSLLWGLIQPYAVLRQAYGSNWFSVFVKGVISTSLYFAVFALLITLGVSFSLYQA